MKALNQQTIEKVKVVRDDLHHILDLAEGVGPEGDVVELRAILNDIRSVCERDLRILGAVK